MSLRSLFVKSVYADHNSSRSVQDALKKLIDRQKQDSVMLNIGAGETRLHPNIKNLEIEAGPNIDIVGSVVDLPMGNETVDLVLTQEVLEHVSDPFTAMREIFRVLRVGGQAYVQLPFIIGYHPCPMDFWRFTEHGIFELAKQAGFSEIKTGTTVGPAIGFYRIAVEFFAILFSRPFSRAYLPLKGAFALLLYPIKWLDCLMKGHPEANRICGGYFVLLTK